MSNIDNLTRLYGEQYLSSLPLRLSRMDDPEGVAYFLAATDEGLVIRQLEFDKYIQPAFKHNIVDDDMLIVKELKANGQDS